MYEILLKSHSGIRYAVVGLLIAMIAKSLAGMTQKRPFTKGDNGLSLGLFIATHIQLTLGLVLYFVSPMVQFGGETMKNSTLRYWTVEHLAMMLIAVVLITMARITAKKMSNDYDKHKRLFIFNILAFASIFVSLQMSGLGLFGAK